MWLLDTLADAHSPGCDTNKIARLALGWLRTGRMTPNPMGHGDEWTSEPGSMTLLRAMQIVTNPGSNLSAEEIERHDIVITPQEVVVDGTYHDTRSGVTLATIDEWVSSAREHPYVLGTSAAQFAGIFAELGRKNPQLLAIMTSRELIQSFDAASSAARTLANRNDRPLEVRVVDSEAADVGAGLCTLLATSAKRQGLPLDRTIEALERFKAATMLRMHVATFDNLVNGGRASFLKSWIANVLGVRPILGFKDGRLEVTEKVSTKADPVEAVAAPLIAKFRRRRVWAGIAHGGVEEDANRLADVIRAELDPTFLVVRPFSPGIYLHSGPGSLSCFVGAVDQLGFEPLPPDA